MSNNTQASGFKALGLSSASLKVLDQIGYETPSPIQRECISHLLGGEDIIGQAQTGTGKTAAFALPLLDKIDLRNNSVQLLVLAPKRELAIQVSEAVQTYARGFKGFHVLPIYGGQSYDMQLRPLKRGVHVVVGTPGRVMDHIKRGTLKLDNLQSFVLDEADEMLKMGFIDDIKWIMERIPEQRQIALFSATMPTAIKSVATQFLNQPKLVKIKNKTETNTNIEQKYCLISGGKKLDALTRILEVTQFDAMIIFARTKNLTVELAEKLSARGFTADAINGDIAQNQRERIINGFKQGKTDILIATDVAARGLDVERISHVVNYDIPQDSETYIHRIGRTGRAGRTGEAILFVTHREKRMLKMIERTTRKNITPIELPSIQVINQRRIELFKQKITQGMQAKDIQLFVQLIRDYQSENPDASGEQIGAALALMAQGNEPLLLSEDAAHKDVNAKSVTLSLDAEPLKNHADIPMCRYRLEVGKKLGVRPGNLLGAIANEADMESEYIGSIQLFDHCSTVDLPAGMPDEIFDVLKNAVVFGRKLNIALLDESNNTATLSAEDKDFNRDRPQRKRSKNKTEYQRRKKSKNFKRKKS